MSEPARVRPPRSAPQVSPTIHMSGGFAGRDAASGAAR